MKEKTWVSFGSCLNLKNFGEVERRGNEMGRSNKEHLTRALNEHLHNITETLQLLDDAPPTPLVKVPWEQLIGLAEKISKQATIAGLLWIETSPNLKELEENMNAYFGMLQGLLLLSHGSTVGAGPTLRSCIHTSAKQVVDCSLSLLKEAVSSYGYSSAKTSIPQLAGTVWNACDSIKKTPTTNYTAIGRAITQVAVSVKDVLRELKELKPAFVEPEDETPDEVVAETSNQSDSSSGGDLGNDLSPEEMVIAQSATSFVSDTLVMIKGLIRFLTGLLKRPDQNESRHSVDSLEKLLELCRGIGVQVDELGAGLYPPQEIPNIKLASEKISSAVDEIKTQVLSLQDSSEQFFQSCEGFSKSLIELQSKLSSSDANDLVSRIQNLAVSM